MTANDNKMKYFISSLHLYEALDLGLDRGISPEDVIFVPHAPAEWREELLSGYTGILEDQLIGEFTDEEINQLTGENILKDGEDGYERKKK